MVDYVEKVIPLTMGELAFKFNDSFLTVYAYLIRTESGKYFLFDSGLNSLFVYDRKQIMEDLEMFMKINVTEEDLLLSKLRKYKLDVLDISGLICSHLHFDHAGGVMLFRNTSIPIYVQKAEYVAARNTKRSFEYKYQDLPDSIDSFNMVFLDSETEINGNSAMRCILTAGHSAGHQSLVLKGRNKSMILTGDAAYTTEQMEQGKIASFPYCKKEAEKTLQSLREMANQYTHVICGHDCDMYANREILL